ILLLTGISAMAVAASAAVNEPVKLDDTFIQKISENGKYAVSNLTPESISIINLESGETFTYDNETGENEYYFGIGKCLSNDGVFVGGRTPSTAEYWKNGEWYLLEVGESKNFSNTANAITPDGSRICGMLGAGEFSYENDVLMIVPCIWNAEGDGYGAPVRLPYPEFDILGRVPQYIKAIDISADGKTVIGTITDATGRFFYPILYKENEKGEWSYEIPYKDLLMPADFKLPENPGDFKMMYPSFEDYMTPAEMAEYDNALTEYYQNGDYSLPMPVPESYMTAENAAEFAKDMAEYNVKHDEWQVKFDAYSDALDELSDYAPSYQDNGVLIASDGKTYASTMQIGGGFFWGASPAQYHVWVFDLTANKIVKYDQQDNLCLSYLANDGVAVASTPVSMMPDPSNSFILKDGDVTGMYEWMNTKAPECASWMKQNMVFEYEGVDEEYNEVLLEELMTGHATSTPDLSFMALSVQNIGFPEDPDAYEDPDFMPVIGYGYIFNLQDGTSVESVVPVSKEKTIYDLYGRKLNEASAPGIYIVNGEKKVVR
ncbi:MAG: hypothetical protein K2H49_08365, partial [Muribaculaceae bacterium]|nr:hypothetical protein [Muribaculaceae bacterium]